MRLPFTTKSVAAKTIAQMVGGVDYFVIGIALLIFGYGIYELVISDLDPRLEGGEEQHTNILSVNSLQSLKNNLSNVIVVGLIVAAFKKTIGFEVNNATDLLALCGSVAMLALSAWLIVRSHGAGTMNDNALRCLNQDTSWSYLRLSRDKRSTVSVQLTQQPIGLIESAHRIGGTTRIRMFFKRPLLVSLPNGAESDRSPCLG